MSRDEAIRRSWDDNAAAWTQVVRSDGIESRRLGTNAAIVAAIAGHAPRTLLDIGCGEGWLCRVFSGRGVDCTGVDASAGLIGAARAQGGGRFEQRDYAAFGDEACLPGPFDAIVCNFALLDEHIGPLLAALRRRLAPGGRLFIHTVHPWVAAGDGDYADGWRQEDFSAFGHAGFRSPMPWYFRRLETWCRELADTGLAVHALHEPTAPEGGRPLSLLIVAGRARDRAIAREAAAR